MAKHRRREQESSINENMNRNMMNSNNNNNNPFGIDPMQLLGLLGGNFDMRNMSNMLASMNTNGFNLNNLGPLAQMAGLNLDNNFATGSNNLNRNNTSSNIPNMSANNNMNKSEVDISKHDDISDRKNNNLKNSKLEENKKTRTSQSTSQANNSMADENLEFLIALRSIVHQSKVPFVDKIIDGYKKGLFK